MIYNYLLLISRMTMAINELRSITTFVRSVELGSLSKAAAAQQITPQAASKALGQLEQHLGVRLFHRTTRSMSLTEEGQRFLESVQPALQGLQQALQGARHTREEVAGPLRIVGPRTVLQPIIGPVLDEYCRLYPEVQPDVQLDDRIGNWVEDRVDVGFRLGELSAHRCSGFRRSSDGRVAPWRVRVADSDQDQAIRPAFSTNDEAFELRAVLAGEVMAQLAVPTVAAHIRAGRLVPLLPQHMSDSLSLHLYYGSRVAQPARVRRFIDIAVERLTDSPSFVLTPAELAQAHARGVGV